MTATSPKKLSKEEYHEKNKARFVVSRRWAYMAFADSGLVGWSGAWTWEVVSLLILKQVDQTPTQRKESTHQAMQTIQKFQFGPGPNKVDYIYKRSAQVLCSRPHRFRFTHSFIHSFLDFSFFSLSFEQYFPFFFFIRIQ